MNKKMIAKVLCLLLILLSNFHLSSFATVKDTVRVLAIGNSFSDDALDSHLHGLATATKGRLSSAITFLSVPGLKL